jgi:hypothetical protein
MGVSIPQPFHSVVDGPVSVSVSPVTATVSVNPTTFSINVTHLPDVNLNLDIKHLPHITLDPVELRITEFPSIRGHLPVDMCVGVSLLGIDLAAVRLCGEAQIITEPYKPGPCERCSAEHAIGAIDLPGLNAGPA